MQDRSAMVPFHGTMLPSSRSADGKIFVALKPIVESMGLNWKSQHEKLIARSWATVVLRTMVAEDGKRRRMACVDLRTLSMWLATVNENRVSAATRPKLIAYQAECADALEAYWIDGQATRPDPADVDIEGLKRFDIGDVAGSRGVLTDPNLTHFLLVQAMTGLIPTVEKLVDRVFGDGHERAPRLSCDDYVRGAGLDLDRGARVRLGQEARLAAHRLGVPEERHGKIRQNLWPDAVWAEAARHIA